MNPFDWAGGAITTWLGNLGGDVASAIDGGVVAVFKDIWRVIVPWFLMALGAFFIILAVAVFGVKLIGPANVANAALAAI